VQNSAIHFSVVPANGCYIPFYPGPCPPPYVIDACDSLTWDFGDGTPPMVVSGSGEVDHVFPHAGEFTIYTTITNAGGSTTIHGSAYICASPVTVVHFSKSRYDVSETAGTLTITLERSGDTSRPFTLNYGTAPGTPNGQYVHNLEVINETLSFAAGETTKQVVHHVKNDNVFTGDFDTSVGVTSDGAVVMEAGLVETAIVHIADDEPGPELTIDDVTVPEGLGEHTIDIPVRLSAPAGDYVYAWCLPHDGTARANVDYKPFGSTAEFEPGQTTSKCQIQILGNFTVEADKTLTVTADPVIGPVKTVRGSAVVTLQNDDVAETPKPPPPPPALQLWFDGPSFRMSAGTNATVPLNANLAANVALTSSDPSVVDVTASMTAPGLVKLYALKPGTSAITAKSGDATATIIVEVTPPPKRRAAR
jgi:PKD repeat protein